MNTQVLEYLIAISEEHSLTRAAERFYLSQPSLSHHLAAVERELGAKLFRKEGRALWPTEEGVIFINNARAILHAEARARKRIEALRADSGRGMRLCMAGAEEAWLRKKLEAELAEKTDLPLHFANLPVQQALEELEQGVQDLVLLRVCGEPPRGSWQTEVLWQDRMVLAMPAARQAQPLPKDLGDLCYLCGPAENPWEEAAAQSLARAGYAPRIICRAPDLVTAGRMVAAGHGCAFLPERLMHALAGQVAVCPPGLGWSAGWVACLRARTDPDGSSLGLVLETLRQLLTRAEEAAGRTILAAPHGAVSEQADKRLPAGSEL